MSRPGPDPPEQIDFPTNWDLVDERSSGEPTPPRRSRLLVAATAWADLAVLLALCAGALVACRALGFPVGTAALPWAAGMAVLVWLGVSVVLLRVRRSWPGPLLVGCGRIEPFDDAAMRRAVLGALAGALTLGAVPAALARREPWGLLVADGSRESS